eukprot:1869425-Pleurochrysis_carterae.AAC.1
MATKSHCFQYASHIRQRHGLGTNHKEGIEKLDRKQGKTSKCKFEGADVRDLPEIFAIIRGWGNL